jgi:hypothetical protein
MKKIMLPPRMEEFEGMGWNVKDNILYIGYENQSETFQISDSCVTMLKCLKPDYYGYVVIW